MAVLGACFAWALDNNFTRKLSLTDATWLASIKGLSAGTINLVIAVFLGASQPKLHQLAGALTLGCFAYGVSLVLFVVALRNLGTARTGAYFSLAPFFGALLAIPLLGESVTNRLLIAGALMLLGIWLHLTERHGHVHTHEFTAHTHDHEHDEHHLHQHPSDTQAEIRHTHWHQHPVQTHTHAHVPDAHHRHEH
jgi:drug/metabolite transporter (DMT)-like permease